MRDPLRKPVMEEMSPERASGLAPLAFLAIGLPWAIWCVFALLESRASQIVPFAVCAGSFMILAFGYGALHGMRNMRWVNVPILLTIEGVIGFALIPTFRFATGDAQIDSGYTHSMYLVLIGFAAYWAGTFLFLKPNTLRLTPTAPATSGRVKLMCLIMLALGVSANIFMWRAGLFGIAADPVAAQAEAGILQPLGFLADFTRLVMIVAAIELFSKQQRGIFIQSIVVLSLLCSLGFGMISGMKSAMLFPFLTVAVIYMVIKRKAPRTAVLLPVFLLVFIYPFVNAYRGLLSAGYSFQVNTVGGLEQTLERSFEEAFNGFSSRDASSQKETFAEATSRISYLSYVRDVVDLPAPSLLNGEEKLWLAPIYPLVPRFLWKNKPVEDKGVRLARALGSGPGTSAAITPIGDLYLFGRGYGVLIGMLVYGVCIQLYMNWSGRDLSERGLFLYLSLLPSLLDLEAYIVGFITSVIHTALMLLVMSYVIYGVPERLRASKRAGAPRIRRSSAIPQAR